MFGYVVRVRRAEHVRAKAHPYVVRVSDVALEPSDARPDSPTGPRSDPSVDSVDDPERVRERIRRRAERIERDEVEEAVAKLEARGGLTDEQRETVRLLGSVLTRGITTVPESTLRRASRGDPATVRTVARLFDGENE